MIRTSLGGLFPEWEEVRSRLEGVGLHLDLGPEPDPAYIPYADSDKGRLDQFLSNLSTGEWSSLLSLRGGSGCIRLLGEWAAPPLNASQQIPVVCGFSDMTYLHAALARTLSLATFWGPNARELSDPESFDLWWAMVSGRFRNGDPLPAGRVKTLRSGRASGPLLGGNLESLAHLCGTPFIPDFSGAILLIEDIDEPLYAIDRALRTLSMAGAFRKIAGVVVGPFSGFVPRTDDPASRVSDLIFPLVGDLPIMEASLPGHGNPMATWPLNVLVDLECPISGSPTLTLREDPFEEGMA